MSDANYTLNAHIRSVSDRTLNEFQDSFTPIPISRKARKNYQQEKPMSTNPFKLKLPKLFTFIALYLLATAAYAETDDTLLTRENIVMAIITIALFVAAFMTLYMSLNRHTVIGLIMTFQMLLLACLILSRLSLIASSANASWF